ncbi:MAG: lamin tail domain-containing protein [Patescibacteria group bacterium]|jgi:hypothetical protein
MKKSASARTQTLTLFPERMKRFAFMFTFLLCIPSLVHAAALPFISEVAWAGSTASTSDEWFEICGIAGTDLSNWVLEGASANGVTLPAGSVLPESGAFLVSNYGSEDTKSTLGVQPDFITTSVALSNAQLFLVLRNASGVLIDTAGASGTAPLAGVSGSAKASMMRLFPLQDGGLTEAWTNAATSSGYDAGSTELGTPGICPEISVEPLPEEVVEAPVQPSNNFFPTTAVRVSEIYPAPLSGEKEWIELVNPSGIGEVLEGWTVEDGKGTATALAGTLLPWDRLVISAPKGSLNNAGDLVILKDSQGRIIDGAAYGDWDTALYPRVGEVAKGEAVIRLELQDAFDVTTVPTPNAANVLVRKTAATSASAEAGAQNPAPPILSTVILSKAKDPLSSMEDKTDPSTPLRSAQDDKKTELMAVKSSTKTSDVPAKKPAASRYKGSAYSAVVAVPLGIYSKTRMYVLRTGTVEELRLSKSTNITYASGQRISFVAQTKEENGATFLLANPKTLGRIGAAASNTFATITHWPTTSGSYRFTAELIALRADGAEVRLDGIEGDVLLPKSVGALKPGDRVEIEGFVSSGTRPRVVIPNAESFRLLEAAPVELTSRDLPRLHLPWFFTATLTAIAGGAGLVAYLRSERLKRLALVIQPLEEDYS